MGISGTTLDTGDASANAPPQRPTKPTVRQAVVVIHGMGEQRPLEALNEFIDAGLEPDEDGRRTFFSRPDKVTDSYESRRYLAPVARRADGPPRAQTEFFEYHWAHLMQDNRLDDLWPLFRRTLLSPPWLVPSGVRVLWAIFWGLLIAGVVLFFGVGPGFEFDLGDRSILDLLKALVGGGLWALALTYVFTRWIPHWLKSGFVDVVRYLDTSPRSYQVRRDIRAGIVNLLQGLHDDGRYQRIIIVAHSLGSYIAYDAISFLWGQMDKLHAGPLKEGPSDPDGGERPDGLSELEAAAAAVTSPPTAYQRAQHDLWLGMRKQGNPWLITDFISVGSPMYMADRIYTRNRGEFDDRVAKRELPTCPPQTDQRTAKAADSALRYTWNNRGRRVLYHAAPFAVTRWTNLWFPAHQGFRGDWFGGPLGPLFGRGVLDIPLYGNRPRARWPGVAHALYYHFADDVSPDSVTTKLRSAMDLASTGWLQDTVDSPAPDPQSALRVDAPLPPAQA